MSQKSKTLQAAIVGVVVAAAIIGGVTLLQQNFFISQSTETSPFSGGETGTLAAQITDPPNVPEGVSHVFISYSDVQVHSAGVANDSGWYIVAAAGTVDLMSVINVSVTLGSAPVNTGLFTLAKFDISSAWITYYGKNDSAIVPLNRISVPISNGGVAVSANASSAFLIDISPTVVPYQNGTQTGFVLVPAATGLPISPSVWHKSLNKPGSTIDINSTSGLRSPETNELRSIAIESASLTADSFTLTVKNVGNVDTRLTSISILQSQVETGRTETSNVMQIPFSTIAVFQILSNGTVILPKYLPQGSNNPEDYSGFELEAGQTVSLSYSGTIMTLIPGGGENPLLTTSPQIVAGSMYEFKVTTSFGGIATYPVQASGG